MILFLYCVTKLYMVSEQYVTETMAATSSTMVAAISLTVAASSSSMFSSNSSVNVLNQPLLLLSNMANMMTIKMDNTNYIVWRHQMTMVLETYSLFELIEEPQLIQDQYLKDLSGSYTTVVNPDFLILKSKEKALLTFLSSTLTPSILTLTVGCSLALEVWKVLENKLSSISRSHVMNLKGELHNIRNGADFVDLYLQKIKVIRDKLLTVGVIVDDEELLHITKPNNNGFNQSFNRGRGRGHFNNRGGKGGKGSNGPSQFSPFNQF